MTSWSGFLLLLALLTLFAVALIVPIRIGFSYGQRESTELWLLLSVGGILRLRFRLPSPKRAIAPGQTHTGSDPNGSAEKESSMAASPKGESKDEPRPKEALTPRAIRAVRWAKRAYRLARPAFQRIERFEWRTELGVGDAAATSLLAGSLWALKSTVVGYLSRNHVFLQRPQLLVLPDYNKTRLALEINCIFRFTVGDIILAALKFLAHPKRG